MKVKRAFFTAACVCLALPAFAQGAVPPPIDAILKQIRKADTGQLAVSEADGQFLRMLAVAKGSKNASTILREMFHQTVTVIVNGKPKKILKIQAIILKLQQNAVMGDHKAIKLALETYIKCDDIVAPNTIGGLMAGQTPFELTAEEYDSIAKHKLLDGVG